MNITAIDIEYEIEEKIETNIELTLDGTITNIDENFTKITGFESNEVIGTKFDKIKHPEMPTTICSLIFEATNKNKSSKCIMKNLRKGGRYYWTYNVNQPILDANGNIQGVKFTQTPINSENVSKIKNIYNKLIEKEKNVYLKKPEQVLTKILKEENIYSLDDIIEEANKPKKKGFIRFFNFKDILNRID